MAIGGPCSPVSISGKLNADTDTSGIDFAFVFSSFITAACLRSLSFQSFKVIILSEPLELGAPAMLIPNETSGVSITFFIYGFIAF